MARNELFNYLTLDKNKDKCHEIVQSIIPHDRKLALWGMGAIGRRVASFLTICNIEIEKIGDENQREVFSKYGDCFTQTIDGSWSIYHSHYNEI